jgi:hypothetical protein
VFSDESAPSNFPLLNVMYADERMDRKKQDTRPRQQAYKKNVEDEIERKIDRDLEDSFPASDPPGWTLGVERVRQPQD